MKTHLSCLAILLVSLAGGAGLTRSAQADQMKATERAVVRVVEAPGWNMGARVHFDRRQFDAGDINVDADIRQLVARLGVRVGPSLHIWGDLGMTEADVESNRGSAGLVYGAGAGLSLFEYALRSSPVVGDKESLGLEIEGYYRRAESEFNNDLTLVWKDARVAPVIVYRVNKAGEQRWRPYDWSGYALRGGPVYSRVSGYYGNDGMESSNEFGALLGVDVRLDSGWLIRAEGIWLGRDDRELSLGFHRFF